MAVTTVATFALGIGRRVAIVRQSDGAYRVLVMAVGRSGTWRAIYRSPVHDTRDANEARRVAEEWAAEMQERGR